MKTAPKALLVLLLGAAVLFFIRFRKPAETNPPAPPAQEPPALSTPALPSPAAAHREVEPAATPAESIPPADESSWAKELRELRTLAQKDPDAALARVSKMLDKHERNTATRNVCLVVAQKDPAKALTSAWKMKLGLLAEEPSDYVGLEQLAKQWGATDLPAVRAWASTLPPDDESRRDHVIKGIASAAARENPAEAAQLVMENMTRDSYVQIDAALDVLRQWAARDFDAAVAWTAKFPEGPLRERSIEELANLNSPSTTTGTAN